jgi:hypothetical protein
MIATSGVDFEIKQHDMTAGRRADCAPAEVMRFDGKTPGNFGVEPHHSFLPGTHRQVAIIAVQVQLDRLVGGKRELEHRPLGRPYRPVRAVDAAAANDDRKSLGFRRRNLAWGTEQAEQD